MRTSLALFALSLTGCNIDHVLGVGGKPPDSDAPGEIRGRVCSADGRSWLADASVYTNVVDSDGTLVDTVIAYTDLDGRFVLEDLPGDADYTVYVSYGDDAFDPTDVYLPSGEVVELPEPGCFDPLEVDVAVITGDYDDFQLVLSNMGFANYTLVDGLDQDDITSFLTDAEEMSHYDIIFINGGALEEGVLTSSTDSALSEQIRSNLASYVSAGGQVYASDWAYDFVETVWPDPIDFMGEDDILDDAQVGEYGLVSAAVADAPMAEWLGSDYVQIEYDLPVWPPIQSVEPAVSVHLSGTIEYRDGTHTYSLSGVPLLVSFTSGEGRVVFSTFRVAPNASTDMMLVLQYMIYNL